MTNFTGTPVVPPELVTYWDDHAQEQHAQLAAMSLEQFEALMPDSQYGTIKAPIGTGSAGSHDYESFNMARFVDMAPTDEDGKVIDHDRTEAIVMSLPFTNGWEPHMAIRALAVQRLQPAPMRMIVFPDNSVHQVSYVLSDRQLGVVIGGDMSPIAEKQARILDGLKIATTHEVDYSSGAMIRAKAVRQDLEGGYRHVGGGVLAEPPNAVARSVVRLDRDFFKTKASDLNGDIADSAIPALKVAQHASGYLFSEMEQAARITRSYRYSWTNRTARGVKKGMTTPAFIEDVAAIRDFDLTGAIMLAGGGESTIFPRRVQEQLGAVTIEGKKHTMGDNVVLLALLARKAIFDR